jgi:predicted  nucleic acid-binding Zn-ribbon protein
MYDRCVWCGVMFNQPVVQEEPVYCQKCAVVFTFKPSPEQAQQQQRKAAQDAGQPVAQPFQEPF